MAGGALTLSLEPIEGASADARGLYDHLFDTLEKNVRAFAKGKPYAQVLVDYLHSCKADGEVSERALLFVFSDGAGLCSMSAVATNHWFEVLLAALGDRLEALAMEHGLAVREKRKSLEEALAACDEPLIVLRKNLFAVSVARDKSVYLISDDLGDDTLDYERLKPAEKKKVDALAAEKNCACKVCEALRANKTVTVAVRRAPKPKYEVNNGQLLLHDAGLTELPRDLYALPIERLELLVRFDTLPDDIAKMTSLRTLSMAQLRELPASFSQLQLTSLALTAPKFRDWETIYALKTLRELWVYCAPELAASFDGARMPQLEKLEFPHCKLAASPKRLASLRSLRVLSLDGTLTEVSELPPNLRELDLGGSQLTEVPRAVASLPLETLQLAGNPIARIAEDALPRTLRSLGLEETKELTTLPESIGELTALEHLAITQSKLARLPESMRKLKKLTYLSLAGTTLPELPLWLGELDGLKTLYLYQGAFTELPESMRALHALEELSVIGTKIAAWPDWLGELRSLKKLLVSKKLVPPRDVQRLKKLLPHARIQVES